MSKQEKFLCESTGAVQGTSVRVAAGAGTGAGSPTTGADAAIDCSEPRPVSALDQLLVFLRSL